MQHSLSTLRARDGATGGPAQQESWPAAGKGDAQSVLVCEHRGSGQGALAGMSQLLAERGLRVVRTHTLQQSLAVLSRELPALIVLDPLVSGGAVEVSALERCRTNEAALPLLLVSGERDSQLDISTLNSRSGTLWDLVHVSSPPEEYLLRAERLLRLAAELADLALWRHRAVHDERTHLLRPLAFQERLIEHFGAAQRHGFELGLVLLDLDRFGEVNKTYDHTVGDALIERVGATIRKSLRTEDVAGRLGGDEFAVLLPYTGAKEAQNVVERLRDQIRRLSEVPFFGNGRVQISASLGYDTWSPGEEHGLAARGVAADVETLRLNAERALRAAKRSGGDLALSFEASIAREERVLPQL